MGKFNARSHLGDLRRGARRRIIRHLVADGGDGPLAGRTTGTVNPGVIWVSRYLQVGVEAIVPIDPHSGPDLGFSRTGPPYCRAIFPDWYGKPIFAN